MTTDPRHGSEVGSCPNLRHLLSLHDENAWSDLLATLIECAPEIWASLVGTRKTSGTEIRAKREVKLEGDAGRIDLLVESPNHTTAAEVKVLSGLGRRQLKRYHDALPDADSYLIIHPESLVIDGVSTDWNSLSWEAILDTFATSTDPWVATTARAAQRHLRRHLPILNGKLTWSGIPSGEDINVGLKARASWIYSHLNPPDGIETDLRMSSAGARWVPRMWKQAVKDDYWIMVEGEERRPVRNWPAGAQPLGMRVRVSLMQDDVDTSVGFDWDYLHALWPLMAAHRDDWLQRRASPKAEHDRQGVERIRATGAPVWLGHGFGEAQTRLSRQCLFGARFDLDQHATLDDIVSTFDSLGPLVVALANLAPPEGDPRLWDRSQP